MLERRGRSHSGPGPAPVRAALAPARAALAVLVVVAAAAGCGSGSEQADVIRVQGTTDTVDAGLVDGLLRGAYAEAEPSDELRYTAVGTGKALENAKAGLADVVITHAPTLEQAFVDEGYSLEPYGRAIFYSDYVVVGPRDDPAGVAAAARHDAAAALETIAAAGARGAASFVSRGDDSGTNVQEQLMWGLTSDRRVVKSIAAAAPAGAGERAEPTTDRGSPGSYPDWYAQTSKGQAANLQDASVCSSEAFPAGGCYTLVDRGTFKRLHDNGTLTNMTIVSDRNAPGARGGGDLLINPFSVYVVNPRSMAERGKPPVNVEAARRFVRFLVSRRFQDAVDRFPDAADPAFRQDAFPLVALDRPLPPRVPAGRAIGLVLHVGNRQPGAPAVTGMPVRLQGSTDGGTSWTTVATGRTDARGAVALTAVVSTTTSFRASTGRFEATAWNGFSPSTQALGTVHVGTGED